MKSLPWPAVLVASSFLLSTSTAADADPARPSQPRVRSWSKLPTHLRAGGPSAEGTALLSFEAGESPKSAANWKEELAREWADVVDKLFDTNPQELVEQERQSIEVTFFPGWRRSQTSLVTALICIPLGICWFTLFFGFVYKHDHDETFFETSADGGQGDYESALTPRQDEQKLAPDVVIVFHHPCYGYSDQMEDIPRDTLEQLNFNASMKNLAEAVKGTQKKSLKDAIVHGASAKALGRDIGFLHGDGQGTTMGAARVALLQDIRAAISRSGFQHTLFCSRDKDEVFLCVSLETDHESAIGHYITKNNIHLQMQPEVVQKMGIDQPLDRDDPTRTSSSPPFIRYDQIYVRVLSEEPSVSSQTIHVKIRSCKGLDIMRKDNMNPYCICQIRGRKQSVFRTRAVCDTTSPVWDEEGDLKWYKEGDVMTFTVYSEDDVLSEVTLESSQFHPGGFDGTLPLLADAQENGPSISVQVEVIGAQKMILDKADSRCLYRTFHGKDPRGSILNSRERIIVIYRELCQLLDLDAAKHHGLITNWYVTHSEKWVEKMSASWANWIKRPDLFFRQPIPLLKDYFGTRLAFVIAWASHYFKCLWALLPLALIEFAVMLVYHDSPVVKRRMVLSYGVLLLFWQHAVANLWSREQEFLCKLWDLDDIQESQGIKPSFRGVKQPSPADRNVEEFIDPAGKASARRLFTTCVSIAFCTVVFTLMIWWINAWEGALSIGATIFLTIMIKLFEICYNAFVPFLIELENHKFQSTFVNSYIWKMFFFRFVNSFGAFIYITVKQRYTKMGCPAEGCLSYLRAQLVIALCVLTAIRLAQVALKLLLVKWNLSSERRKMRTEVAGRCEEVRPDVRCSVLERQAKFNGYRFQEQIEDMLELVIALGYVLLFGAVAPSIIAFCLVVFWVQIGTNSQLLLHFTQRSLPRSQKGVGAWHDVIHLLNGAGMLFSAFLFATESDMVGQSSMITKLSGFVLYFIGARCFMLMIDTLFPATGTEAQLLLRRRAVVQRKLQELVGADHNQHRSFSGIMAAHNHDVDMPDWKTLPYVTEDGRLTGEQGTYHSHRTPRQNAEALPPGNALPQGPALPRCSVS